MPTAQSPACLSPACYLHGRVSSSNLGGARPRGQRVTLRQVTGDTNKKNSIFQGCPTILLQSNLTRTRRWTNKRDTRASPLRLTHSANPGIRRRPRLPCHGGDVEETRYGTSRLETWPSLDGFDQFDCPESPSAVSCLVSSRPDSPSVQMSQCRLLPGLEDILQDRQTVPHDRVSSLRRLWQRRSPELESWLPEDTTVAVSMPRVFASHY